VAGVIGELLITAGTVALLFVAWQLWIGDLIIGAERSAEASALSEQWAEESTVAPAPDVTTAAPSPSATATVPPSPSTVEPVILPEPADTEVFGVMRIPRFGSDYLVEIAGGVTRSGTLDAIGIGHYPGTPMPGAVGNVALAAHRTTFGKPFNRIAELRIGDAVVIETREGWYTYRFRTLEYVTPDAVSVLLPVPQEEGVEANGRYLTLTSCAPMYSRAERIIAYTVFESYTPREAGEPASLAAVSA
jgi:sortase A